MLVSTEILLMIFLLLVGLTCSHILKSSGHKYLQEAGLVTLVGVATGGVLLFFGWADNITSLTTDFTELFLVVLLPPIIFESGYAMDKKPFFKNIGAIMAYSFIGTFIAIFSTSTIVYYQGKYLEPAFTWIEAFAFASLISATDPVSVLAIFKEMNADHTLNAIVFGESIFNDAIAIVMYNAVTDPAIA